MTHDGMDELSDDEVDEAINPSEPEPEPAPAPPPVAELALARAAELIEVLRPLVTGDPADVKLVAEYRKTVELHARLEALQAKDGDAQELGRAGHSVLSPRRVRRTVEQPIRTGLRPTGVTQRSLDNPAVEQVSQGTLNDELFSRLPAVE